MNVCVQNFASTESLQYTVTDEPGVNPAGCTLTSVRCRMGAPCARDRPAAGFGLGAGVGAGAGSGGAGAGSVPPLEPGPVETVQDPGDECTGVGVTFERRMEAFRPLEAVEPRLRAAQVVPGR